MISINMYEAVNIFKENISGHVLLCVCEKHWFLPALDQIFSFYSSLSSIINLSFLFLYWITIKLYIPKLAFSLFFLLWWAPNHWVLLLHLSNVLKNFPFLLSPEADWHPRPAWWWQKRECCEKRLFSHQSLYSVRTEMCEFIFDCVIFDLAQSELARELFQSLEYLPCYELVLKSLFDFPEDSFPVIFDRMLESGLYLG